ncbi:MerR family transcriptional regulator [Bacillus sp. NPDC077027]|uniref:MerR family transcriptional regulator n=1 Tax=Bacillus sp. NPDC077027 TaxID=3390548 RepID=UPI003D01BAD4
MQYLTSGEMAKLLNITKYTLRHYVDQGLIKPSRIDQNGYQLYGEKEVYMLYHILFLRKVGFSIQSIKSSFSKKHDFRDSFQELLSTTEQKIQELKQMKEKLEEIVHFQNSLEINHISFQERQIRYLKKVPQQLLKGETELNLKQIIHQEEYDLSAFDERYFLLKRGSHRPISYYKSNEYNFDVILPAGKYAVNSFFVDEESQITKEMNAFLNDAGVEGRLMHAEYIILYENIPLSVAHRDAMVYSVEICAEI